VFFWTTFTFPQCFRTLRGWPCTRCGVRGAHRVQQHPDRGQRPAGLSRAVRRPVWRALRPVDGRVHPAGRGAGPRSGLSWHLRSHRLPSTN